MVNNCFGLAFMLTKVRHAFYQSYGIQSARLCSSFYSDYCVCICLFVKIFLRFADNVYTGYNMVAGLHC